MTGTLVNVAGIALGSLVGLLLKKGIPEHINNAIVRALGLGTIIIGLLGIIKSMFSVDLETGALSDSGSLLLVISLAVGCVVGELLRIDDHLNNFGRMMENRLGASGFAKGFVTASLLFPIGAMTVIGALNDGLFGDSQVLYVKSLLDTVMSVVLSSALGIGVLFSAVPVLLIQGSISLLAGVLAPHITQELLNVFCMVGYALVTVIGLNLTLDAKIKVANLLPALAVPIFYHFLFVA